MEVSRRAEDAAGPEKIRVAVVQEGGVGLCVVDGRFLRDTSECELGDQEDLGQRDV